MKNNKIVNDFVLDVVSSEKVFALGLDDGLAMCLSNYFLNDDDEFIESFCFWSSFELAKQSAVGDWCDYKVQEIELSVFLEDWCMGMSNENYAAGINFGIDKIETEADPLELLLLFLKELEKQSKTIELKKFKNLKEFIDSCQKAMEQES